MSIDPSLLEILACPADHSPVDLTEAGDALVCRHCGSSYPVRDGIPVMLVDEATPGPNGVGESAESGSTR